MLAATMANLWTKRGAKRHEPEDFMPEFGPKEKQSTADQLKMVEMLNTAYGGLDLRDKDKNEDEWQPSPTFE